MEQLTDFFRHTEVNEILDVGTGTGDFIPVLTKIFRNARITGVDPNVLSLHTAAEKYSDVLFAEMNGENLNFDDQTFDIASISMALHHLPDVQKSLKEMKRVVKKDGWIIVNELFSDNLNPAQEVHKMFHHFRSSIDRILGISHNETFKKEEILKMVAEAGIEIQFQFESVKQDNQILTPKDLDDRVEKMKDLLDQIKDLPEYELLKPEIDKFREGAKKYGFQPATNVVVVGKV